MDPDALEAYAGLLVGTCLNLSPGETLFLQGSPAHRDLVVALADAGYRFGARLVDINYTEPRARASRIRHVDEAQLGEVAEWDVKRLRAHVGPDRGYIAITGEGDPGVFDGLDPERVALEHTRAATRLKWLMRASLEGRARWTGCAWPTTYWAGQVYPELASDEAQRKLGDDLLWFARLGPEDPGGPAGWLQHASMLAARARMLSERGLERLIYRDEGTELEVRLSPGTVFAGGQRDDAYGNLVSANVPTEECFTSPQAGAAEGTFRCSLPLSFHGRLIEGIAGEFRGGKLVRLEADSDADRDFLAAFLDSEPGARRLGEVSLVDSSSRIGRSGRIYFNTLLDENAAAHIAFGAGFGFTRAPDAPGRGAKGVNRAMLHLDVMIGTDDLDVTGVEPGGAKVPLIAGGVWQI